MGIWNSHTSVGNILGSLIAGSFVSYNWGLSFIIPGLLMCFAGFMIYLFLVPNPQDVGIVTTNPASSPTYEYSSKSELHSRPVSTSTLMRTPSSSRLESPYNSDAEINVSPKDEAVGFFNALKIPGVLEFSLCLFFAKLVSYTFLYWLPNYINIVHSVNAKESAMMSTYFDIGGIIGGVLAGLVSDKSGMSATTCTTLLFLAIPTLFYYESSLSVMCPLVQHNGVPILNVCFIIHTAFLIIVGILVNGPYALITTAVSAELGTHKSLMGSSRALATVTSIIDGTGSVGAAVGPFMAGYLSGHGSWTSVFNMLMLSNVFALLCLSRLVKGELRRWQRRRYSM